MYKEDRDINLTDGSSILEVGKTETGQPFFGKCEKMSARLGSHRHQVSRESRSWLLRSTSSFRNIGRIFLSVYLVSKFLEK